MSKFKELLSLNVNDKVEKKDGLSYLSWSFAWGEFKKIYPIASYKVLKNDEGLPYFYNKDLGYMCFTSVNSGEGEEYEMWLPVMDSKNKTMKNHDYEYTTKWGKKQVSPASMFDVNKTLMRCLVKNLAMFGLGLYIYSGEDLPTEEKPEPTPAPEPNQKWSKESAAEMTLAKRVQYAVDYLEWSPSSVTSHMRLSFKKEKFSDLTKDEKNTLIDYLEQKCEEKRLTPKNSQVYRKNSRSM